MADVNVTCYDTTGGAYCLFCLGWIEDTGYTRLCSAWDAFFRGVVVITGNSRCFRLSRSAQDSRLHGFIFFLIPAYLSGPNLYLV